MDRVHRALLTPHYIGWGTRPAGERGRHDELWVGDRGCPGSGDAEREQSCGGKGVHGERRLSAAESIE